MLKEKCTYNYVLGTSEVYNVKYTYTHMHIHKTYAHTVGVMEKLPLLL